MPKPALRRPLVLGAALALALSNGSAAHSLDDPPTKREQEKLIEEYQGLDPWSREHDGRRQEILERLESVPSPAGSDRRRWERYLEKSHRKALKSWKERLLPRKAGEYFDRGAGSGRYLIAGETRKPTGLFLGLHGGGLGSGDAASARSAYADAIEAHGWLGLFPEVLEKTEHGWTDSGTDEWCIELVERALVTFEIDPQHVYFGGHSMGGYGSWVLGAHHADRVAALLPSAGAPTPVYGRDGTVRSIQKGVIPNLRNVPMCVFQSTDDPRVPPDANQAAVKQVSKARARYGGYEDFEYWEVSDRGHGYPEGGVEELIAKIEGYAREPRPDHVVWQPDVTWKRQFYWLWWQEPVRGATVEARLDREENKIEIELIRTDGAGLHVLVGPELVDMQRELTVLVNEEQVFQALPPRDLATWLRTQSRRDPGRCYEGAIPLVKD